MKFRAGIFPMKLGLRWIPYTFNLKKKNLIELWSSSRTGFISKTAVSFS